MKRKKLVQMLEEAGYRWAQEGDHTTMYKPGVPKDKPPLRGLIQVPRHTEINEITAKETEVKTITIRANVETKEIVSADELRAAIDAAGLGDAAFFKVRLEQ